MHVLTDLEPADVGCERHNLGGRELWGVYGVGPNGRLEVSGRAVMQIGRCRPDTEQGGGVETVEQGAKAHAAGIGQGPHVVAGVTGPARVGVLLIDGVTDCALLVEEQGFPGRVEAPWAFRWDIEAGDVGCEGIELRGEASLGVTEWGGHGPRGPLVVGEESTARLTVPELLLKVLDLIEVARPVEAAHVESSVSFERDRVAESLSPVGEVPHHAIVASIWVAGGAGEVPVLGDAWVGGVVKELLTPEHFWRERLLVDGRCAPERPWRADVLDVPGVHLSV